MVLSPSRSPAQWLVSAYFASYLGHADSASWILLSYIWGLIGKYLYALSDLCVLVHNVFYHSTYTFSSSFHCQVLCHLA